MGEMVYLDDFAEQKEQQQSNIKARVGKAERPNLIQNERAQPVQAGGTGVTIKITKGTVNYAELERGGIPMPETPKDNASRPWSDELEAHKKMTDQRFNHIEKINTMQYESIQKDMRHGFELIANRIGSLEDKIVASEKDVTNKFDSFENKLSLKMNEQKNEIIETLRKERKEDHKYIFTTLIAIVSAAVGVLAWIL
ncbi:hypothetical protein EalM137_00010 [Exiguobacterium phage vB_EalM-137]|nr:hypothetical protein EalM137_00010 [Exiguobacterium phage vB_EalM-137]